MIHLALYITSGLFLGWLLGTKDSVNAFGSSVSTQILNFKSAAILASAFIILGAVFQGRGTTTTIHYLGNITDPIVAFLIALCAAIFVLFLFKIKFPVSTSQTIVGGIIGWSVFSNETIDWNLIFKIVISWILAPLIGIILGVVFFIAMRAFLKKTRIHLIQLDSYLRITLILAIALAAFGLGANNIGNVIGVYTNFAPNWQLDFGAFKINGIEILFLLGGVSIGIGIFSYSKKSVNAAGEGILSLAPETTIIVLLSQAIVLFLFSSIWFSNVLISFGITPFLLVPVSSTQIVVGVVLGIGIVKGAREIEIKTLASIGLSWIIAPIGAALLSFFVFFSLSKLFNREIFINPNKIEVRKVEGIGIFESFSSFNLIMPGIIVLAIGIIALFIYLYLKQQRHRYTIEKDVLIKQNQLYYAEKAMNDLEMQTIAIENEALNQKLKTKKKEFMDLALSINEQYEFLEKVLAGVSESIMIQTHEERTIKLKEVSLLIKQKMSFSQEKKEFYSKIEEIHKDFHLKLTTSFPNITSLEKRLAGLMRLNLSTKEISSLLNISPKSVEVAKYRLKKKLKIEKEDNLKSFINHI